MDKAKSIKMSMGTNSHLDIDSGGTSVDQKVYRFIIGSLLYLCASRSDIMLSVYVSKIPRHTQILPFKGGQEIMRYLVLTPNLGLWYSNVPRFELIGYSDVDYAVCKVDRNSTSRTCQFLGWSLVSWSSKK
jgi:hypothetical protein